MNGNLLQTSVLRSFPEEICAGLAVETITFNSRTVSFLRVWFGVSNLLLEVRKMGKNADAEIPALPGKPGWKMSGFLLLKSLMAIGHYSNWTFSGHS